MERKVLVTGRGREKQAKQRAAQCRARAVKPGRLGLTHSGETLTLPLLSLRGPGNITLYLSICIV